MLTVVPVAAGQLTRALQKRQFVIITMFYI